ncbi:MAG: MBOAT family protein [Ignavibacteriaceae bacterium]
MCWRVEYIFLIIFSTLVDYFAGLKMGQLNEKNKRKKYLYLSLITNLGLLFTFKYFNFFTSSLNELFSQFNIFYNIPSFNVLLPVGISFYTFQTLSYTIEVYRGNQKPEKHLGIFALYVSFFPQLVAGPIERSQRLLPQFYKVNHFSYKNATNGIKQILWGFFKKVVIADRIAVAVQQIYSNPTDYQGIHFMIAMILFGVQVYCDFSGYSDIAIGSAKILGYDLMKNFDRPFFAKSLSELWHRWHISLSTWFRDYIYIPLGGKRVIKWRWYFNLFISFAISGLWHGSDWTYVSWGVMSGLFLIGSVVTVDLRNKLNRIFLIDKVPWFNNLKRTVLTVLLFDFSLVYFRSQSLSDAFYITSHFFDGFKDLIRNFFSESYWRSLISAFGMSEFDVSIAIASILILFGVELLQERINLLKYFNSRPRVLRWSFYYIIIIVLLVFGAYNTSQQFIYFQF